jgi:hypothetical protein
MAYNFLRGDRDQPFLLPDLRDWLPEGHLAWFILDVVDQLDLTSFYRAHRADGHGHPAYDTYFIRRPQTHITEKAQECRKDSSASLADRPDSGWVTSAYTVTGKGGTHGRARNGHWSVCLSGRSLLRPHRPSVA